MKKYLLIVLCLFILIGCSKVEETNNEVAEEPEETVIEVPEEKYTDDNPIKVGLYMNGKLMNEYNKRVVDGEDLLSVDVYFTDEADVGSSNTKYNFNKYYNNYENISNYKIGFDVSFDAGDKHYHHVVLDPDVEYVLNPYVYIYLYDDVHQADGSWYSHITMDEYNENTIFSSIKLYMAERTSEITSPITLKVFTYDSEEDFDEEGNYRGISSHTMTINNG